MKLDLAPLDIEFVTILKNRKYMDGCLLFLSDLSRVAYGSKLHFMGASSMFLNLANRLPDSDDDFFWDT